MVGDRYQAKVITGQAVGAVYPINKPEIVIGRNPTTDIPVRESDVSRRHAVIYQVNDEIHLRDEGSTNGTFVNGRRITESMRLTAGDTVRLGSRETLVIELEPFLPTKDDTTNKKLPQSPLAAIESARDANAAGSAGKQTRTGGSMRSSKDRKPWWILLILLGVLFILAVCLLFLWYIDANFLWCWLVPVLPACP